MRFFKKNKLHSLLPLVLFIHAFHFSFGQQPPVSGDTLHSQAKTEQTLLTKIKEEIPVGLFPKQPEPVLKNFSISGYYRFLANYRNLGIAYPENAKNPRTVFIGDDSQIPQLLLNISGKPSPATTFGTDLYLWSPMTGIGQKEN